MQNKTLQMKRAMRTALLVLLLGTLELTKANSVDLRTAHRGYKLSTNQDIDRQPQTFSFFHGDRAEIYWHEVVTAQPDDYLVVDDTVFVSSAESFTWWAKNGCSQNLVLDADIDLAGYKWLPVCTSNITLDGRGHIIYNLYVDEYEGSALFRQCSDGIISNLGVEKFNIYSEESGAAALCNAFYGRMYNCHVTDGRVEGNHKVGGLICDAVDADIINCYAEATLVGRYLWGDHLGFLIGEALRTNVRNCYAYGDYNMGADIPHHAGIAGMASEGQITNCYSVDTPLGLVGESMGTTYYSDTSSFYGQDIEWTLNTPITFDDTLVSDLCKALYLGVIKINENGIKLWQVDNANTNRGYPIFGDTYHVTCPNVNEVSIKNIKTDEGLAVLISWNSDENVPGWQIKYKRHDSPNDTEVLINATSNPYTIYGIPLTFEYDFNVRSVCGESSYSGWSATVTKIVDLPYWTDIVTTQPEGYVEDNEGNIIISSAEGLAWLSSESNGINTNLNMFYDKKVILANDIDLSQYSWYPIADNLFGFQGSFDGCGHKISGIYINSNDLCRCGLFGYFEGGLLQNVIMDGGLVRNRMADMNNSITGGLVGLVASESIIMNCHSSVQVEGFDRVGCLLGESRSSVFNCSANGTVTGRGECGGLIGFAYGDIQIDNCYSTGDVVFNHNPIGAWAIGGLIGQAQFIHIHNCYSVGNIMNVETFEYVGKVIGLYDATCDGSNLYKQQDNSMFGMFGLSPYGNVQGAIQDTASFTNSGNDFPLTNSININGADYSDLLNTLNAWVDANNSENLYSHWVADSAMVNGGFPLFGWQIGHGIAESETILVSIYPNPTNGQTKIEAENIKHITITNTFGQTIYDGNTSGNAFEYDFSKHKAGIYLIRIETTNGVAVKKVSVTR